MTNANDARKAHNLLDDLDARAELSQEQEKLLRSFLPERPKQKTLEEITIQVLDAWSCTSDNCWGGDGFDPDISIEDWLKNLHAQLQGLKDAPATEPAHPEFLETEEDYENAPLGTVVIREGGYPWTRIFDSWVAYSRNQYSHSEMAALRGKAHVLRWGLGE